MKFHIPSSERTFEVPDEWWEAGGMVGYVPNSTHYTTVQNYSTIVPIAEVEPPLRTGGLIWFRDRTTVVELLQGIRNGSELPPVRVWGKGKRSANYAVRDGLHRFYLSIAAGFTDIPIMIDDFDLDEFFAMEASG